MSENTVYASNLKHDSVGYILAAFLVDLNFCMKPLTTRGGKIYFFDNVGILKSKRKSHTDKEQMWDGGEKLFGPDWDQFLQLLPIWKHIEMFDPDMEIHKTPKRETIVYNLSVFLSNALTVIYPSFDDGGVQRILDMIGIDKCAQYLCEMVIHHGIIESELFLRNGQVWGFNAESVLCPTPVNHSSLTSYFWKKKNLFDDCTWRRFVVTLPAHCTLYDAMRAFLQKETVLNDSIYNQKRIYSALLSKMIVDLVKCDCPKIDCPAFQQSLYLDSTKVDRIKEHFSSVIDPSLWDACKIEKQRISCSLAEALETFVLDFIDDADALKKFVLENIDWDSFFEENFSCLQYNVFFNKKDQPIFLDSEFIARLYPPDEFGDKSDNQFRIVNQAKCIANYSRFRIVQLSKLLASLEEGDSFIDAFMEFMDKPRKQPLFMSKKYQPVSDNCCHGLILTIQPPLFERFPDNFDQKTVDIIRVVATLPRYRCETWGELVSEIKEHRSEISARIMSRILESAKFQEYGVPINFFQISSVIACKDYTLEYILEIKKNMQ